MSETGVFSDVKPILSSETFPGAGWPTEASTRCSTPDTSPGTTAVPTAPAVRGAPSVPSSVNDSSPIRKNRHTPLGERIQSSREIAGEDAMSRRVMIVSGNVRVSSTVVQRSRRMCFTQTNATRPGLMMVKSHTEPDFGW